MPELAFRISEPGKPTKEVPIKVGLSLGRLDENTVTIVDSKISGRHAHVIEKDGQLVIEDLGSSNHTHVLGGASLKGGESHPLQVGTMIQLGETKLVVVAVGESAGADKTVAAQMITLDGDDEGESGGAAANLALLAAFKAARARLVIANEAIRKIADIDKIEFVIGRKDESANLVIEHQGVSSTHAAIRFEKKRFYIEDLSTNGTFVGNEKLESGQKRHLLPETHVRFGSIDALFVVSADADGNAPDSKRYRNAVEVLIAEGRLPASQRDDAIRDAQNENRHPGEILLQKGLITVEDWLKAFKKAEFFVASGGSGGGAGGAGGGAKNLLIVIVVLLLALVILLIAKPGLLSFGG